jgi:hypothetical protein
MREANRNVIAFLEKEIDTYKALALFLAKEDVKKELRARDIEGLTRPSYYQERMKEARKLIRALKK